MSKSELFFLHTQIYVCCTIAVISFVAAVVTFVLFIGAGIAELVNAYKRRRRVGHVIALAASLACSTAHAGGYCNSCYHPAYVQHDYAPQTIVEHQENFFALPNYAMQYAVTPSAIQAAKLGEAQRAEALTRDRLAELTPVYAQQQPVQAQAVCQPMCVVPQGYQLVPIQPGAQPNVYTNTATQPAQQPMPPQPPPDAPPQKFSLKAGQSIIQQACLKCHGGNKVEGDFDLTRELTCEQKQKAIAKVALGEMPKNGPKLSPEQFVQLTKEISAMKTAGASSAPVEQAPAE